MSVHIYKYRLQCLYGRDLSSGINAWFCTYCAHFPGIDTPSQKMHDNEVSKLDMWLAVEELMAYQAVMAWGMVFGVVVPEVGASRVPVNIELDLAGAISDPVEAHANHLQPFLIDIIVCKPHYCGVIYLHGSGGLGMSEFLEVHADWQSVFGIYKSGANFGFRC